jgi:similar to stage IV sporulation protein
MLGFLHDNGLGLGSYKRRIDHKDIQRRLLNHFPDIIWADVHTKGTRTTVTLVEALPKQLVIANEGPANIVAARDGYITGIVTGAGTPLVRRHDVVKRGEVMVSGEIPVMVEHTGQSYITHVRAYAEVWARTYTPVTFNVPFRYTVNEQTGSKRTHYRLQWLIAGGGGINLFHGRILYANYDRMASYTQWGSGGDYPLPFILSRVEYRETVPVERTLTPLEARTLAERMLTVYVINEFDIHADIIEKNAEYIEKDNHIEVQALIIANQRIDATSPLIPSDDGPR